MKSRFYLFIYLNVYYENYIFNLEYNFFFFLRTKECECKGVGSVRSRRMAVS